MGEYDVETDDTTLSLSSQINYVNDVDSTQTTSLSATNSWSRIDSIRFGAKAQNTFTDDDADSVGLRKLSNWNIDFGTVVPHGADITISANIDDYLYIIVDHEDTITELRDSLGTNNITNFTSSTVGDYKVYVSNNPVYYDNSTFNYTITAS